MVSSTDFHKDFAELMIATSEIGVTGLRFDLDLKAEAISALLNEPNLPMFSWRAAENAALKFKLERENDHSFLVEVTGKIPLTCACVRCLGEVHHTVTLDFMVRMLEMEHLGMDEDAALGWRNEVIEMDLTSEDDEDDDSRVGYFRARTLDLGIIMRDQLFLMTPDYPHCDMDDDALVASRCKVLSSTGNESDQFKDNPFVKKFGKTKQ